MLLTETESWNDTRGSGSKATCMSDSIKSRATSRTIQPGASASEHAKRGAETTFCENQLKICSNFECNSRVRHSEFPW